MREGWRISANWRLQKARYRLVGEICPDGHFIFPPRDVCPECAAIAYHGLRQTDEEQKTIEAGQFESIILLAGMAVAVENS